MEAAKDEQALTDMKIANILTRKPFKRKPKWVKFFKDIQRIVYDYDKYGDILNFCNRFCAEVLLSDFYGLYITINY